MTAKTTTKLTLNDRRAELDAWQERVKDNERHTDAVLRAHAVLDRLIEEFGGDAVLPTMHDAAFGQSALLTAQEVAICQWQFRRHLVLGGTEDRMWDLLEEADTSELAKLEKAYPVEVAAIRAYRTTDLWTRVDLLLNR